MVITTVSILIINNLLISFLCFFIGYGLLSDTFFALKNNFIFPFIVIRFI